MAELYLIRHGQASFGAEDYDRLSGLGEKQCLLLGAHVARFTDRIKLVTGSHLRHHQSKDAFLSGLGQGQQNVESLLEMPEFNEFDHEEVLFKAYPEIKSKKDLAMIISQADVPKKAFHLMFQASVERWISGHFDDDYKESWLAFQQRCIAGLDALIAENSSSAPMFLFTSGGPISVILKHVMALSDKATFALNDNLANSGITRLLYSNERISPSYINNFSHLEHDNKLISYR